MDEIETLWREACHDYLFAVLNGLPERIIKVCADDVLKMNAMLKRPYTKVRA